MTKSNTHAILADLHKLLSSYSTDDFLDASNYGSLPPAMREALRALSHEAEPTAANGSKRKTHASTASSSKNSQKPQQVPRYLVELIQHSPHFNSAATMITYAKSIGLKLNLRPKESRERLARRLAALISKLPKAEKEKIISNLSGENNQTQGWIDVIKSRNK